MSKIEGVKGITIGLKKIGLIGTPVISEIPLFRIPDMESAPINPVRIHPKGEPFEFTVKDINPEAFKFLFGNPPNTNRKDVRITLKKPKVTKFKGKQYARSFVIKQYHVYYKNVEVELKFI